MKTSIDYVVRDGNIILAIKLRARDAHTTGTQTPSILFRGIFLSSSFTCYSPKIFIENLSPLGSIVTHAHDLDHVVSWSRVRAPTELRNEADDPFP